MRKFVTGHMALAAILALAVLVAAPARAIVYGLDVYAGNGVMDWPKIAAGGKDFTMVKATQGNYYQDAQLGNNENGATANGVLISCYDFADPVALTAVTEANYYYNFANSKGAFANGKMVPMLDLEQGLNQSCKGPNNTTVSMSTWAVQWCQEVTRLTGLTPMIYCNQNYAANVDATTGITNYPLFLAAYDHVTPKPGKWSMYTFQQYSSSGRVAGDPNGAVDLDIYNGSLASLISNYAIGGVAPAATVVPEPATFAALTPLLLAFGRRRRHRPRDPVDDRRARGGDARHQ